MNITESLLNWDNEINATSTEDCQYHLRSLVNKTRGLGRGCAVSISAHTESRKFGKLVISYPSHTFERGKSIGGHPTVGTISLRWDIASSGGCLFREVNGRMRHLNFDPELLYAMMEGMDRSTIPMNG